MSQLACKEECGLTIFLHNSSLQLNGLRLIMQKVGVDLVVSCLKIRGVTQSGEVLILLTQKNL
jgi:hypothetical protein